MVQVDPRESISSNEHVGEISGIFAENIFHHDLLLSSRTRPKRLRMIPRIAEFFWKIPPNLSPAIGHDRPLLFSLFLSLVTCFFALFMRRRVLKCYQLPRYIFSKSTTANLNLSCGNEDTRFERFALDFVIPISSCLRILIEPPAFANAAIGTTWTYE